MAQPTKDWELYQNGVQYNHRMEPDYFETVEANWDFYSGNQWRNLPDSDMPKPVFNVIKRVISFFVASLTTSKASINFEPYMYSQENPDPSRMNEAMGAEIAKKQVDILFEKFKMEFRIKDALFDAAVSGDAAAHFYFDMSKKPYGSLNPGIKGEICMELVDGTNIFFGNANNSKTDNQPYIIISGREMVSTLKEEAAAYKNQDASIQADSSYQYEAGSYSRVEVQGDAAGKAEYIIVYRKVKKTKKVMDQVTGIETDEEYSTIHASKSVENAYIYQDIDTGLEYYPISWMNWEKQKNTYHGRALATGILPNQIFINRAFAMIMYHLMMTAFPKAVYNADVIESWDNSIGSSIGVSGVDFNANMKNIAGYLEPGNISTSIMQTIDTAMQYTKEMLGATDAALGQIDPKNTSAIIAVTKSSAIPLENPKANMYEWMEDNGKILMDMMGTYYGQRPVMVNGQMVEFDFDTLKDMWLDVRADVGESSYWSEIASSQTLDNLLASGHINFEQYLKRQPDSMIPQKEELLNEVRQQMMQQAAEMQIQQALAQQQMPQPQPVG